MSMGVTIMPSFDHLVVTHMGGERDRGRTGRGGRSLLGQAQMVYTLPGPSMAVLTVMDSMMLDMDIRTQDNGTGLMTNR